MAVKQRTKKEMEALGFFKEEDGSLRIEDIVIEPAAPPALTNKAPESRLIITDIFVRDFKSYAGEQRLGPFNKNFTAIVGPNGSGKSNVIDALMFVFGHRAKKIRALNVSALIHNSSARKGITSCKVVVDFVCIKENEKTGQWSNVKDSGFVVARMANSDNSSSYEINNQRRTQKEVIRFLRQYGIDMNFTRFLILQGEIEHIAQMHPKALNDTETGMLEYIEDIIGSCRYIEPIKYYGDKVKMLTEQEEMKTADLKLVEKERDELEIPKNNAVEYLRKENKSIICENSIFHFERRENEVKLQNLQENKAKFVEEMEKLKSEMNDLRKSKKTVEKQLSELNLECGAIYKKCEEKKEEFKVLEREDAKNLMEIKHAREKAQNLKRNLEELQNEVNKLSKQATVYENETGELEAKKQKLSEEKEVFEKKATEAMSSLKEETVALQEEKDNLEAELIVLKKNFYQVKSEMDLKQSEVEIYMSSDRREKEKLTSLIKCHKDYITSTKNEEALLKKEEDELASLEPDLCSLREQLESAKQNERSLLQQLREERQALSEARNTQQSSQSSSYLATTLMREKTSGRIPGIYGRLGDLGAIDEKFDVAISTACGRLDNIVTDTLSTAQSCVEFLKKNNAGYATFIALDEMKKWEPYAQRKISTPENVPRLFDLVRVQDTKLLPAFYFALQDTLVAKDLDQATRVGFQGEKRYRAVTLKGEIVDLAGTMSGGGGRVNKGRMGQTLAEVSVTDDQIAKISASVDALSTSYSEIKNLCINLEDQITKKSNRLGSLQHSLRKRRTTCKAYKEQVEIMSSQIAAQEEQIAESSVDQNHVQTLQEEIKEIEKKYKQADQETSVVEEKVKKLQEEILKISKGKMGKAKKTVELHKKKVDEVTQAITKSKVNFKQSKTKITKVESKIQNIEKDLEANSKVLLEFKDKKTDLTNKGTEISLLITQYQEEMAEFKAKQLAMKKEIESLNAKEHEMKKEEIEQKNDLKTQEAGIQQQKQFIKGINAKIADLKLNEIDGEIFELPFLSNEEIANLNLISLTTELEVLRVELEEKRPILSAIEEYNKKRQVCQDQQALLDAIKSEKELQNIRYDELRKMRLREFLTGVTIIIKKFKEIYKMFAFQGDTQFEMAEHDPFESGINLTVRPPNKSWKCIRYLSGGEKTLTALALVFALHYYRPTPFYVMDEIDAALDKRNVGLVAKYLMDQTKNAQFIVVSLRNVMNELSEHLMGIFKVLNLTSNIVLDNVSEWADEEADDEEMFFEE